MNGPRRCAPLALSLLASACGTAAVEPATAVADLGAAAGTGALAGGTRVSAAAAALPPGAPGGASAVAVPAAARPPPAFATCRPRPFTPGPRAAFVHTRSDLVAGVGDPGHTLQDVVADAGAPAELVAKIAYGAVSKDLEDEPVRAWLDDCTAWRPLGEARTDGDGRARFPVKGDLPPGRYAVRVEVPGDGSGAEAALWVLSPGARLAFFDIDGTLTTSDEELVRDVRAEIFEPLRSGTYTPSLYPGAVALTHATRAAGLVNVYLTGRPYWLAKLTRDWVASAGLAPGVLHTTDSNPEAMTTESGVGDYKLAFLRALQAAGFSVEAAHGNATTDVYAYLGAGIPPERVWIIGKHAGLRGTRPVKESWEPEVARIRGLSRPAP